MKANRTRDKKFHQHCGQCKYFRIGVQPSGRWLEMCAATGEQLIWRCGGLIKSDNCPFVEVIDDK